MAFGGWNIICAGLSGKHIYENFASENQSGAYFWLLC